MEIMERGGGVCDQVCDQAFTKCIRIRGMVVQRYIAMKGEWVQIQEKNIK